MYDLPSQNEVKASWSGGKVRVTCLVNCYNQQDFIYDCLKSIICQKTNFPFKVVVYDDFSDDGTRSIISQFEKKYPDIFDVYYAEFNHRGVRQKNEHLNKIEGEFVALCEGDDYWINDYKLSKQLSCVEDANVDFCIHPAIIFYENSEVEDIFCFYGNNKKILSQETIFDFKNQFAPTASYFIRTKSFLKYLAFRENFKGGAGDFFMEVFAADKGVLYLPEIMSSYRRGVEGGHSFKQSKMTSDQIGNDLVQWSLSLDGLSKEKPYLIGCCEKKLKLIKVDCLLRNASLKSNKERKEIFSQVSIIMRDIGAMSM